MRYLIIVISFLFMASSLYMTNQFNSLGQVLVLGLSAITAFVYLFFKNQNIIVNKKMFVLFYCFVLFGGISAALNQDIGSLIGVIVLLVIYVSLAVVFPSLAKDKGNEIVVKSVIISHIPLILLPILIYGFNSNPYQGIFYNPNAFGSVAVTVMAVATSILLKDYEKFISVSKITKRKLLFDIIFVFSLFALVVMSGSRTSFLTALVVLIMGFLFLTISVIKAKRIKTYAVRGAFFTFVFSSVFSLFYMFTSFSDYLYWNIIYKFERKSGANTFDGRDDIWVKVMNDAGLFGQGRDYFNNLGIGSHNTFISILGQYGWVPLTIFILFLILGFRYCLKYVTKASHDEYRYVPVLLFLTFATLSMGEGMLFKLSMVSIFCCIGVVSVRKKQIHVKDAIRVKNIPNKQYSH